MGGGGRAEVQVQGPGEGLSVKVGLHVKFECGGVGGYLGVDCLGVGVGGVRAEHEARCRRGRGGVCGVGEKGVAGEGIGHVGAGAEDEGAVAVGSARAGSGDDRGVCVAVDADGQLGDDSDGGAVIEEGVVVFAAGVWEAEGESGGAVDRGGLEADEGGTVLVAGDGEGGVEDGAV